MEEIHPPLCFLTHIGRLYVLYVSGIPVCSLFSRRSGEEEAGQRAVEAGQASRPGLVFNEVRFRLWNGSCASVDRLVQQLPR
jgi:hypothetical protein